MSRAKLRGHMVPPKFRLLLALPVLVALCASVPTRAQAQGDESSSTTESNVANESPSRTTESHTKSGNRTVDKQTLQVLGPNGRYEPASETEKETVQVDGATTRTIVRTYKWDTNGNRKLSQVTEEELQTTASGDAHMVRKISTADPNGNVQVAQREVAETKKIGAAVEETNSTIYRADGYGGLSASVQTQELKKRGPDESMEVKKTTKVPDGNGNWRVGEVSEKSIKQTDKTRTTEEKISNPDAEGRLSQTARTVAKETATTTGERSKVVETYLGDVPGYGEGTEKLTERVITTQKKDAGGETTEQQVEQPNASYAGDGPKVTARTKYVVKYATPGAERTKTVEMPDVNGNFSVVSSETQKSSNAAAAQQQQKPPAENPKY